MTKWVYSFSAERAEGRGEMKNLLGGKGANLHEMASLGLPVPPGFTITTEVCTFFYANGKTYSPDLRAQVDAAVAEIGRQTGRAFGDAANPLLLSVRSGARASMPGMMDTVLNLGLNDDAVETLAKTSGDARFAYDSYRRFIDRGVGRAGLVRRGFDQAHHAPLRQRRRRHVLPTIRRRCA